MQYDENNIFARIIRGEIPCQKVCETGHALAFYDIQPVAPTHILVIPTKGYTAFSDFMMRASAEERSDFFDCARQVVEKEGLVESGFRLVSNEGRDGGQEVPHFHMHILGGRPFGSLLSQD